MSQTRSWLSWILFLGTFFLLPLVELGVGPVVLWPSLLAIGLAFITRQIHLSLFLGAWAGAILLREGNFVLAYFDLWTRFMLPALGDGWNLRVLIFTLLMGGLVGLLETTGGIQAFADWLVRIWKGRRGTGLTIYFVGWGMFFDGLASAMLLGQSMRSVADRAGISREKLAYIVDSTASPIAGLSLISTWVAYELSVIQQGLSQLEGGGEGWTPLGLLVSSVPFRFYNWFCLLLVFLVLVLQRDVGPMRRAAAVKPAEDPVQPAPQAPGTGLAGALAAGTTLIVLVLGVAAGLWWDGGGPQAGWSLTELAGVLGRADAASVFVGATAFAAIVCLCLSAGLGLNAERGNGANGANGADGEQGRGVIDGFIRGMERIFAPALILVLAWTLNGVLQELKVGQFLAVHLSDQIPAEWFPALVFLLAAGVSFSTGTSWGTMAIVTPLAIPLAGALAGADGIEMGQILVPVVGAVLAGAVFGDHCSPLSDTTIVSAFSSGCGTVAHTQTQLPYALMSAGTAVVAGYALAGSGFPAWASLSGGALVLAVALWLFGSKPVVSEAKE